MAKYHEQHSLRCAETVDWDGLVTQAKFLRSCIHNNIEKLVKILSKNGNVNTVRDVVNKGYEIAHKNRYEVIKTALVLVFRRTTQPKI